jgi:hypothetical protein
MAENRKRIVVGLGLFFAAASMAQQYTADGEFIVPADYREWIFLSSGIGMTYSNTENAHPAFGNVFVNPAAYKSFLKTGTWPDKTMLLIEDRTSDSKASNKEGRFQARRTGFEAHVKDASHGGWQFYLMKEGVQSAKPFAKQEICTDCHNKNAAVDTTFVQFYPTLIDAAKKNGTWHEPPE